MRRGSARVHGGAPGRCANARTTGCGERCAGDAKSKYSDALTGEMAARTIPLYVYLFLTGRTRRGFPFFVLARPSERRKSCRETPVLRRAATAICAGRPRRDAGKDTTDEHRNADERCVRRRAGESGHERAKTVFNLNTCNTRGVAQQESGLYLRGATMAVQVRILPPRPN